MTILSEDLIKVFEQEQDSFRVAAMGSAKLGRFEEAVKFSHIAEGFGLAVNVVKMVEKKYETQP